MLFHLGYKWKEKVCGRELHNFLHVTYKDILIEPYFRAFRVWKNYQIGPSSLYIGYLYFILLLLSILNPHFYYVGIDFTNIGIDDLVVSLGLDKLIETKSIERL